MATIHTEVDFERLSWHDCHIWGIELRVGDRDEEDWTSDLALDLDFIVEWLCDVVRSTQFRVAPAGLAFHGVTDLKINIDWGRSGHKTSIHHASIGSIERERIQDQQVYLDRPYYAWRIRLNWPASGEIAFGAVGFTQTLQAEPIVTDQQCLSLRDRSRLTSR